MISLLIDSSSVGGIERHVATLAAALIGAGIPAEIVLLADHSTGDRRNPWIAQIEAAGVPLRCLDGRPTGLVRALSSARPAVLHTHGYKANIIGRLAARLLSIPIVSSFHAGERGRFPVNAYQILDEWTSFLGGRIAVSEAIQRSLPFRSTMVQNFLLVPPEPPVGALPRRIGFVGRLSHEKGPDRFCELARRCRGVAEWHVWGDGPMREALERTYGGDVQFHGLVTELGPVWSSLGLLVMPSRAEGLPMASLEALAAGVPIAASAVGGLPDVVVEGQTGWLFDAADLDAAAQAIDTWARLDTAAAADMRRNCWSLARERFSEKQQLPKIMDVYRRAGLADRELSVPA